jgi:uncharacterized protein (DUF1810 family)
MSGSLSRFIEAQSGGVFETALREIEAGRKRSHWMWFIFPQLEGLGQSATARRYGISGLGEAADYLADDVLGGRLRRITRALLGLDDQSAEDIFGHVDGLKLRSSMTLFSMAAPDERLFADALDKYYGGGRCGPTVRFLEGERKS